MVVVVLVRSGRCGGSWSCLETVHEVVVARGRCVGVIIIIFLFQQDQQYCCFALGQLFSPPTFRNITNGLPHHKLPSFPPLPHFPPLQTPSIPCPPSPLSPSLPLPPLPSSLPPHPHPRLPPGPLAAPYHCVTGYHTRQQSGRPLLHLMPGSYTRFGLGPRLSWFAGFAGSQYRFRLEAEMCVSSAAGEAQWSRATRGAQVRGRKGVRVFLVYLRLAGR